MANDNEAVAREHAARRGIDMAALDQVIHPRIVGTDEQLGRQIVRDAAADEYRWSSIVLGIVKSPGFLNRSYRTTASN